MKLTVLSVIAFMALAMTMTSCNQESIDNATVVAALDSLDAHFEATGHTSSSDFTEEKDSKIYWRKRSKCNLEDDGTWTYNQNGKGGKEIYIIDFKWFLGNCRDGNTLKASKKTDGQWNWLVINENGDELTGSKATKTIKNTIKEINKYLENN